MQHAKYQAFVVGLAALTAALGAHAQAYGTDTLAGDWHSPRRHWFEHGVSFATLYTGDFIANRRGEVERGDARHGKNAPASVNRRWPRRHMVLISRSPGNQD